jgi:hypothetical protein
MLAIKKTWHGIPVPRRPENSLLFVFAGGEMVIARGGTAIVARVDVSTFSVDRVRRIQAMASRLNELGEL